MWIDKHKPLELDGFLGKKAVETIRAWDGRPMIVHGGNGTGKSLLAGLTCLEKGWELIEVDANNIESASDISSTSSLYGTRRLMLIEDVDSLKDIKKVTRFVAECRSPLLMTTSDYSARKLASIKKKCADLELRKPMPASLVRYLKGICMKESVQADDKVLEYIAKNAKSDIRAAINDLETLAAGRREITMEDALILSARDVESDIYRALSIIFGGKDLDEVGKSTWNVSEQPRDILLWIDENMPLLYKDANSIHDSMHNLSRADIFLGRIMRRQYWGFLRYVTRLMTCGVNISRPEKISYTRYQFPSYFASLGRTRVNRRIAGSISEKIGPIVHASSKVITRQYIPLFKTLLTEKVVMPEELADAYRLNDEELDFLVG
ncbi:hypothetical protein ACFLRF_04450 [Candidatus Altiarchaeota archaeon]